MDLLEEGKNFLWKIFLSVVRPESSQHIQYNSFHIQEGKPRNKNYYNNTSLCMRFRSRQVSSVLYLYFQKRPWIIKNTSSSRGETKTEGPRRYAENYSLLKIQLRSQYNQNRSESCSHWIAVQSGQDATE